MGACLGLDLGEKRVGIAHTDESGSMAFPLKTLEIRGLKHLIQELQPLLEQYRAQTIVVGLPSQLDGTEGPAAQKIRSNVDWLKTQIAVEWILWDERLTTAEVNRVLEESDISHSRRREVRDALAAQRILQSYLDEKGPEKA